jgi:hypothetical protein
MAAYVIAGNLDAEATWAGVALRRAVRERISLTAALLAALAPPGATAIEVWAPAAVDPAALRLPGVTMRVGVPPHADLWWAQPGPIARAANDRRLALAVAPLAGARAIASLAELDGHAAATRGPWVCKAPWTAAGRDRAFGEGPPRGETRAQLARLLARHGAVVYEPWLPRVVDLGTCGSVDADGAVALAPPHALLVDGRGRFRGIGPSPPALAAGEADALATAAADAGAALARLGYAGPFTVDAFVYRTGDGGRRLRTVCEINARYTFGAVARALGGVLGFGPAPDGATVLVGSPQVTAWTTRKLQHPLDSLDRNRAG